MCRAMHAQIELCRSARRICGAASDIAVSHLLSMPGLNRACAWHNEQTYDMRGWHVQPLDHTALEAVAIKRTIDLLDGSLRPSL